MYEQIIEFWFEEIDAAQRWKKDAAFDELIRSRFARVHSKAIQCELFSWRDDALGRLAEIIVLDQFSRNMYRGKPESFSYDPIALTLAQSAIFGGHDMELSAEQRSFLYMPFMHSESLLIHEKAVALFTQLSTQFGLESTLEFENKHKAIIETFGRYPHRNEVLGRVSTDEELLFLAQPGSGF